MNTSKIVKIILFSLAYGFNLFWALMLHLCGNNGNIMLGIIAFVFYRLSLWFSPLIVTGICWLPLKPKVPARTKLLFNFVHLIFCGILFLVCYLLTGNWY